MLRLLVLDVPLNRKYACRFASTWSSQDVLDWIRRVRFMPSIHTKTSLALYDDRFPPLREPFRQDALSS